MERTWIVDGPWIAKNVKNASVSSTLQIQDCEAYINCPNCSYHIDNNNVSSQWPGLPYGVKFDPTDEEVIEHLEAKCGIDGLRPHLLINDFICSLTEDVGINYTHPQNLPGVNKDGISVFFFNKTTHAYQKGQRKRRKITPTSLNDEPIRWHKTGKTKPVMLNGVQKGCKKIMVLYKSARKGLKPEKSNWVMHQYHLGTEEREVGEFVVSKITYQLQKQWDKTIDESESFGFDVGSRTPKISIDEDEIAYDDSKMILDSFFQGLENTQEASLGSTSEDNLVCKIGESWSSLVEKNPNYGDFDIGDLENADLGTLPNLPSFASEDSLLNWLDGFDTPK